MGSVVSKSRLKYWRAIFSQYRQNKAGGTSAPPATLFRSIGNVLEGNPDTELNFPARIEVLVGLHDGLRSDAGIGIDAGGAESHRLRCAEGAEAFDLAPVVI